VVPASCPDDSLGARCEKLAIHYFARGQTGVVRLLVRRVELQLRAVGVLSSASRQQKEMLVMLEQVLHSYLIASLSTAINCF
jgi:hypothetical protein